MRSSVPAGRPRRRTAAAAVELAAVAPVLVLLIFGMIEFGRVMMVEQVLTNAAREGARRAALPGSTSDDAKTVVSSYLTSANVNGANPASVSPDPSTAQAGTAITVTVTVPFSSVSWLPVPQWMGGQTLTATVVMAKESNNS
ncbi:MAG TPA: TadE/TadG family type IV pilus assembly protein [Gemmataceae bacterium]|nr:TadE/TadG family type IV pilus assembly protein [Gemmataceae bacterium]